MKIVITGSHGTGKSTLAKEFPNRLAEVARTLIGEWGHPSTYSTEKFDMFELEIINRQIREEERLHDFISDRCVIDVLAYCTLMASPKCTREVADIAEYYIRTNPYDLVFYTPIEFVMEKDGVRYEEEHIQVLIDLQIKKYLHRYNIKYITLTGSVEQRLKTMNTAIQYCISEKKSMI